MTKQHIFAQFINDDELLKFIPTGVKSSNLTRELLLSVLAYIRKDKYLALYGLCKEIKLQKSITGNKNYDIKIQPNLAENLENM